MPQHIYRPKIEHKKTMNNFSTPAFQIGGYYGRENVYSIPISPSVSTSSISSGATTFFDLDQHELPQVDQLYFRFTIQIQNADVQTIPFVYWIKRLIIEANKGSGDELWRGYSDILLFYYHLYMDDNDRERWAKLARLNFKEKSDGTEKLTSPVNRTWRTGKTYEIYLPIPPLFINLKALDMYHIANELRFRFEWNSDFVESGTATNVLLNNIHLIATCFEETPHDRERTLQLKRGSDHKIVYLDSEFVSYNDRTITAGTENLFATDSFIGHCPFLILVIKPSTSPVASDKSIYNFQVLGEQANLTFQNSAGQDLLGNGSKIRVQHLNNLQHSVHGRSLEGVYIIPFTENIKVALTGVMNGCHYFTGIKDFLNIEPKAGTAEVHSITGTNAANDGGYYRLKFQKTGITAPILYSANNATVKAALEAIPEIQDLGYTITVASAPLSTTPMTITFSVQDGTPSDEIGEIQFIADNCNDGGVVEIAAAQGITTYGTEGFTTGASYTTTIYMMKYKELIVKKNGTLFSKDV